MRQSPRDNSSRGDCRLAFVRIRNQHMQQPGNACVRQLRVGIKQQAAGAMQASEPKQKSARDTS